MLNTLCKHVMLYKSYTSISMHSKFTMHVHARVNMYVCLSMISYSTYSKRKPNGHTNRRQTEATIDLLSSSKLLDLKSNKVTNQMKIPCHKITM